MEQIITPNSKNGKLGFERLFTVPETARLLRVSPVTLRLWRAQGKVSWVQLGRRVLFRPEDIKDFVQQGVRQKKEKNR